MCFRVLEKGGGGGGSGRRSIRKKEIKIEKHNANFSVLQVLWAGIVEGKIACSFCIYMVCYV